MICNEDTIVKRWSCKLPRQEDSLKPTGGVTLDYKTVKSVVDKTILSKEAIKSFAYDVKTVRVDLGSAKMVTNKETLLLMKLFLANILLMKI